MACAEDDERALQERKKSGYLGFDPDGGDGDGWGGRVSALSPPLGHQPWVASPAVRRTEEKARTRGGEGRPSASATRPCPARRRRGGSRPCLDWSGERERERERERDGLGNLDGRVDVKETQGERALGKNASASSAARRLPVVTARRFRRLTPPTPLPLPPPPQLGWDREEMGRRENRMRG
uniref:Uncharacterized protein n=1 Tax=Oryza sativa subsp. japonica TaxID=39947 RepID=Q6ZKC3_ORYSJ|nr:hypothetical protein [Oryza sativa Japonica Group]